MNKNDILGIVFTFGWIYLVYTLLCWISPPKSTWSLWYPFYYLVAIVSLFVFCGLYNWLSKKS